MADTPFFSVIMPAYNAGRTLNDSAASVLAQECGDFELLIVDDGSTDETPAVLARLAEADGRVRVLTQENAGAGAARNAAAAVARGRYLALLDADDLYLPDYLGTMKAFIEAHPGLGLYSCTGRFRFPGGRELRPPREARPARETSFALIDLLRGNRIFVVAVVSAEAFAAVGGFRDVHAEDYDLWLRLLAAGLGHRYLPRELAIYRITAGSKSAQRTRVVTSAIEALEDVGRSGLQPADEAVRVRTLTRLGHALEIARLDERLARGELGGARRSYLPHAGGHPTRISRVAGLLTMVVSPRLYRRVMIRMRTGETS